MMMEKRRETSVVTRHTLAWFLRQLVYSWSGLLGLLILFCVLTLALFAPWIAPFDPVAADFKQILKPPLTAGHPLGTDQLGRDLFSRIIYGSQVSLLIGFSTVCIAGLLGSSIGILSGYFGGRVDSLIMRLADVQLSFPFILLALTINAIIGVGLRNMIITLVLAGWVVYARVVRSQVLALRETEFVAAARALGARHLHILWKYILPNVSTPIIVVSTLQVAQFIVAEAAISFLGFGVQPPTPAWGNMLSEGRDYLYNAWWLTTFPGIALALTALGVNLFGDWLRDTLDPKLQW